MFFFVALINLCLKTDCRGIFSYGINSRAVAAMAQIDNGHVQVVYQVCYKVSTTNERKV